MKILLARLYDQERQIQNSKIASARKIKWVLEIDQKEFVLIIIQGRVTDHRINFLHKIEKIIEGEGLMKLII